MLPLHRGRTMASAILVRSGTTASSTTFSLAAGRPPLPPLSATEWQPLPARPRPRRDHGFRHHVLVRDWTTFSGILARSRTAAFASVSSSAARPRPPPLLSAAGRRPRPPRPCPRRDRGLRHPCLQRDHGLCHRVHRVFVYGRAIPRASRRPCLIVGTARRRSRRGRTPGERGWGDGGGVWALEV